MKIVNASSKIIVLLNGVKLLPKKEVNITVEKGTELFNQIKNLEKKHLLDIN